LKLSLSYLMVLAFSLFFSSCYAFRLLMMDWLRLDIYLTSRIMFYFIFWFYFLAFYSSYIYFYLIYFTLFFWTLNSFFSLSWRDWTWWYKWRNYFEMIFGDIKTISYGHECGLESLLIFLVAGSFCFVQREKLQLHLLNPCLQSVDFI
jgi:hypothetical protein